MPTSAQARSRHSYATAALAAGISPKVLSARLGHASIAGVTLDIHSRVLPEMEEEAAASVAALILGPGLTGPASPSEGSSAGKES